ncbi:MAG: sulfatase-like hydrolase/transferase [Candidatus Lokiarchaeota archaeon]|nr:sulfatase-like hydrolase/transferase [Candidatus Lokiarchaeota archaeon]MBD3202329.1 sulfatase-like hydrolase/transferase [Candidatus Lokiarchaeota archaeon]
MSNKPNIVFLFEDHQAYYGHGKLGNGPKIQKPNFERVASEGIHFTNAYTACPLCGPARRTILTGLYPHNHGEIKNETNSKYLHENYLLKLAEVGYKNYYFGKWHAGRGTALDFQCDGFSVPGYGNPYTTPEYEEYIKENKIPFMEVEIQKNFLDPISKSLGINKGDKYKPTFPAYSEYVTGIMTTPKESHEAFFLAELACNTLEKIAEMSDNNPFHLRVDFWGPHEPYFAPQEYIDLYSNQDIPEHPSFADDLEDKPEIYKFDTSNLLTEDNHIKHPNPLPWSEWRKVLEINYAEQTLIDEAGGLILKTLDKLGLADNTIVVWAADHGDGLACHGGHFDKDSYMPQEMVRVPMAVRYPDMIKPDQICDKFVSNIDYAPTFLELADNKFKNTIDGESLVPLFKNIDSEWRDDIFCETHGHFTTIVGRLVVYDHYKYIYNEGYKDELYDLKEDPFELENLIDNSEYGGILKELKERLSLWRSKTNDKVTFEKIKGKKLIN